ncbi:MAG: hypothetical protein DCC74_09200 [Proteobacteria bacterium]|nr:MAG: hypothetical protein DCC74_09200 [Pseudomonadota bacterium]
MKFLALSAALSLVFVVTAAEAQNQGRSGTKQEQDACTRDVTRYCRKLMDQGDLVILSCLQQNRTKLTKACQQVLVRHGQ